MDNEKVKNFILQARKSGTPDAEIVTFLKNKGVDLSKPMSSTQPQLNIPITKVDISKDPLATAGKDLVSSFKTRGQNAIDIAKNTSADIQQGIDEKSIGGFGKVLRGIGEAGLQQVGNVAGGVADIFGAGLDLMPGVKSKIQSAGQAFLDSKNITGQTNADTIKTISDKVAQNPHLAKDAEAAFNILTLGLGGASEAPIKEAVVNTTKNAIEQAPKVLDTTINTVTNVASKGKKLVAKSPEAIAQKGLQDNLNMTGDILNNTQIEQAIKEGRTVDPTTFNKGALEPSSRDLSRASLTSDVINPKQSLSSNISNAFSEIKSIAETKVRPFLRENLNPYNPKDFINYLKQNVKPSATIDISPKAKTIFDRIGKEVYNIAEKHPPTLEGLLDTRIKVDNFIKDEFGKTVFTDASKTAVEEAALKYRESINNFITDSLKFKGNIEAVNRIEDILTTSSEKGIKLDNINASRELLQKLYGATPILEDELKAAFYKFNMKKMNALYEAADNMATRARQGLNMSKAEAKLKTFKANNPIKTKVGKTAVGATIIGKVL